MFILLVAIGLVFKTKILNQRFHAGFLGRQSFARKGGYGKLNPALCTCSMQALLSSPRSERSRIRNKESYWSFRTRVAFWQFFPNETRGQGFQPCWSVFGCQLSPFDTGWSLTEAHNGVPAGVLTPGSSASKHSWSV